MATLRKRGDRWQVQVRRLGCQTLSKSFLNRKHAEAWARQTEIELDRAALPPDINQLKRLTLGDLVVRYRNTVTPQKRAAHVEVIVLNAFLRHPICSKSLHEITQEDFDRYRDERLQQVKPKSLKRMLSPIQNLWEVAKDDWHIPLKGNPISKLKILCEPDRRERRLQEGELDRIVEAAKKTQNPLILPIILFALETALRRSEILQATWRHADLEKRLLSVPRAKNGHPRVIPLSLKALEILKAQKQRAMVAKNGNVEPPELVFPTTATALLLAWNRLTKRARIKDLHFHDLRHEAISRLFERGLTIPEAASISGHRDPRMLFRYAPGSLNQVLSKLNGEDTPSALEEYPE